MKKLLFIAAIAVVGLTSCKKDYTCTCVILGQTEATTITNSTKKDATNACNTLNTEAVILGGTCTLN